MLENIKWLDRVLTSGSSLAGIVVLLKLLGFAEFQWVGIKFTPASAWIIGYAWVLFCLFTIAHYYVASLAINSLHKLWLNSSVEESERTFSQVTRTGNIFVRGLLPRTKHFRTAIGLYLYEMRIDDPTAWVSYLSSVLLMLAMVPFDLSNIGTFAIISVLAAYAVVMNWLIGSNWIVALSELVIPRHKSVYHARREQRRSDQRLLKMEGVAGWIGCTAPLLGLTIALLVITLGSLWDNACCLSGIAVLIMLSGSVALWLRYGIDWDSMS